MSELPTPEPLQVAVTSGTMSVEELDPPKSESPSEPSPTEDTKPSTPDPNVNVKPAKGKKTKEKPPPPPKPVIQLVGDLPRADDEARAVFEEIEGNHYQYGTLGRSREALESMMCDCSYDHGVDRPGDACGPDSDCINRLTQVECLPEDCKCRAYCQNQRFQKRSYADIHVVQTEKKGFGLRAGSDLRKDTFIYEYVGDVVAHASFQKRMRDYAAEGIRHFYFMMLQRDEFIDATKRGGIGRFANHSCAPNCYVAKWTVGTHVRMGIFASRLIHKDEELTFNYNVDRYGHEAQPCYCGEPQCVGLIGGKTQTGFAGMADLELDALGITEEVERLGLKGRKKGGVKGKKLDDPDFVLGLKPCLEKEVPKVVQAMRQTQSKKVLAKLLMRIKLTEDQSALRQLMRLRGFSLMTNILDDHVTNMEIVAVALEAMMKWPLLTRNKVDDSKVAIPVGKFAESAEDENVKTLAQKLLDHWNTFESGYRIPKRAADDFLPPSVPTTPIELFDGEVLRPAKRSRFNEATLHLAPKRVETAEEKAERDARDDEKKKAEKEAAEKLKGSVDPRAVAEIIANAAKAAEKAREDAEEAARVKVAEEAEAAAKKAARLAAGGSSKSGRDKKRDKKKAAAAAAAAGGGGGGQTKEEKELNKEKRLLKLVGAVVVKFMSKHKGDMDTDLFKKHAKELTQVIANKEKKSSSYKEGKLEELSEEKVVKIKKFAKEYIAKVLHKLEKEGKRRKHGGSSTVAEPSTSMLNTPNSNTVDGGGDVTMAEPGDHLQSDSGSDMDEDDDEDEEMEGGGKGSGSPPDEVEQAKEVPPPQDQVKVVDPRRSGVHVPPDK